MSSTTNVQSYLPYVFRPVYTWTGSNFTTTFNLSNIDILTVNTARFSTLYVGDSSNNLYLGCNAGNLQASLASCNSFTNTAIGVSAGAALKNSSNSEFLGYQTGSATMAVNNSIVIGAYAGTSNSNVVNSILIGTSNTVSLSNISNTIAIGGNAGGTGNSNIFIGTSTGTGVTGSSNTLLGQGLSLANIPGYTLAGYVSMLSTPNLFCNIPANVSNKLFIGSGSNVLIAGDFSNGVVSIGSTNTSATTCNTYSPTSTVSLISLDVSKWMRVQNGLAIGFDPGYYNLDVNGNFRVTDGYGWIAMSNYYNGAAASNSFVEIKPVSTGTMTLAVTGATTVTGQVQAGGLFTVQGTATGVLATSSVTVSNVITRAGLLSGTVYDTVNKNYYNANVVVLSAPPSAIVVSSNIVLGQGSNLAPGSSKVTFLVTTSNITISNADSVNLNVSYNFTYFPTA